MSEIKIIGIKPEYGDNEIENAERRKIYNEILEKAKAEGWSGRQFQQEWLRHDMHYVFYGERAKPIEEVRNSRSPELRESFDALDKFIESLD